MEKEILIIGGGPGGYEAAIRASQLGAKVTLIEEKNLGGTCLNWGCIPTKSLYKNAEVIHTLNNAEEFGVELSGYSFDMEKIIKRKDDVVSKLKSGIEQLLKGNKIEVIYGKASFKGNKTVEVITENGTESVTSENIIIATGSNSSTINVPGMNSDGVITSTEALDLVQVPKSMVIIGGGVIGIEFAGIYATFGTEVTIIEFLPRLMFRMDEELSKRITMYLKKNKIKIVTGAGVKEVIKTDNGFKVIAGNEKGDDEYICENVLVATGRIPNVEGLNLEAENIEYDRRGIRVNENYETSSAGIYAIGDVIGGQMLAHVASEEGKICVEKIFGHHAKLNYDAVPSCIFSFPEVSSVGFSEEELKEKNIDYLVGKSMFGSNGKALTMGEGDGIVKVLADTTSHRILGVHIIGPHASDLIQEGTAAIQNNLTVENIKETVHSHPTLTEVFLEAVCACIGEAIHSMPAKKR